MRMNEGVSEFWETIEKEHRAKVGFKTYAVLIGKSSDMILNMAGILYIIDDKVVFENFEKSNPMLQIFTKKKETFRKYKIHFSLEDVLEIKEVSGITARRCIDGSIPHSETKIINPYLRFLLKSIWQIRLRSGYSLFFDLLDSKNFVSFFRDYSHSIE
jgi:hypothetical protein